MVRSALCCQCFLGYQLADLKGQWSKEVECYWSQLLSANEWGGGKHASPFVETIHNELVSIVQDENTWSKITKQPTYQHLFSSILDYD